MSKLHFYQKTIEEHIGKVAIPAKPKNLYDPLRYFLTIGGKRTRPSLTLLSCAMFGEPGLSALDAALSIELFHNFTLIHDDIMDEAPLRRGKTTVHEKWNRDIAILSGDVLYTMAFKQLLTYPAIKVASLLDILTQVSQEVCEGQQMDMDFETSDEVTIDDYIEMIRLKTSVLLGAALQMGAVVAGVEDEMDTQNIYDFGVNIGLAFQIQDDILDLYADPDKFGKQVGGDILSNKKTFLLLKAFEQAKGEDKKELHNIMDNLQGEEKINQARIVFDRLGVREAAEDKKQLYYERALNNMKEIKVKEESKKELLELAEFLMTRDY